MPLEVVMQDSMPLKVAVASKAFLQGILPLWHNGFSELLQRGAHPDHMAG